MTNPPSASPIPEAAKLSHRPIGIFDSGIGGTTILRSVQALLPQENFIYFGDSKNCPFGTKSPEELKTIVRAATDFLLQKHAKLVIVACNTATTQTIDFLRTTYPGVSFVGTEPAIKLACDSGKPNLLLLSTEGTAHSPRTQTLIDANLRPSQTLTNLPALGLAEAIETCDLNKIRANLAQNFKNIKNPEQIDLVILGCTHYPLIKSEIQKFFPHAQLIDGGTGVARQTQKLLKKQNLLNSQSSPGSVEYFFSKPEK